MLGDVGESNAGSVRFPGWEGRLRSHSGVGLVLVLLGTAATYGSAPAGDRATATFAGGCFWCMEAPFAGLHGVLSVTSGYTGGHKQNPTYDEVSSGATGHAESVQVIYDPAKIGYERLLEVFWRNIDPLARDAQFCDHGTQYRSAIFYHDEAQRSHAGPVPGDAEGGDGAFVPQRVLERPPAGHLRGRGLGRAALQLPRQVRVRHRLAHLHPAPRKGERQDAHGLPPRPPPHRGPVGSRRLPPGTRLPGRPRAHRPALLHELGGAAIHPPGGA